MSTSAITNTPETNLNGVDIVGDNNQLSLALLDQGSNVVQTVLQDDRLLGRRISTSRSLGLKALGLLGLVLRAVLVEQLEESSG